MYNFKKKKCSVCGKIFKPASGAQKYCKGCNPSINNGYYKKARRRYLLKYRFNLTLEQYDQMFEEQNGVCAICRQTDVTGHRLAVDHDHKTGKVRGLLCYLCNTKLGCIENKEFVKNAKRYLKNSLP